MNARCSDNHGLTSNPCHPKAPVWHGLLVNPWIPAEKAVMP